jgi:hypothetical protein
LQVLAEQSFPVGQALPHVPQFAESFALSTQMPVQSWIDGLVALHVQTPAAQVCPATQALPHEPQFEVLVSRSTQLLLQAVSPALQEHFPPIHEP